MKVFQINECEWYMGDSLFDAVNAAMKDTGLPFDEACDYSLGELTPETLNRLMFVDEAGDVEERRTFAEQLARQVSKDAKTARIFATTEI